jgi:hypothetical protein
MGISIFLWYHSINVVTVRNVWDLQLDLRWEWREETLISKSKTIFSRDS